MKKYVIRTGTGEAFNAAGKARKDADRIAVEAGFEPFEFTGNRTANGSISGAVRLALDGIRNWRKLSRTAEAGSVILVQYPHYPMKSAYLARNMMLRAKRRKGLRFIALIHDLDSLRGQHGRAAVYSDTKLLPMFDDVICHNERMKAILVEKGIPVDRLITLGAFDYLTDATPLARKAEDGFAIAGNLSPNKCGYVLEWIRKAGKDIQIHLYGKGMEKADVSGKVTVHGTVVPEELPGVIAGGYGIVWDGPSAETCAGDAGHYLMYNNPHKLSLYLAAGMPVVMWEEAAAVDFVRTHGTGITVKSLMEAEEAVRKIPEVEYAQMAERAKEIGIRLRQGNYLRTALDALTGRPKRQAQDNVEKEEEQ